MDAIGGSNWQSPGSPSSAADNAGQGRQLCVLQPLSLIQFMGSGVLTGNVTFRVEVPDSRVRVKLALLGVPTDGSTPQALIGAKGLTLWLRAVEDSQQGASAIPITNLWGTHGEVGPGPGPIPGYIDATGAYVADAGLGGWGKEFVTIGKAIMGTINYPTAIVGAAGHLILQVEYSPEGTARFARDEWQEIVGQAGRSIVGGAALRAA